MSSNNVPVSTKDFNSLSEFKQWLETDFKKHCLDKYGEHVFVFYIRTYLFDFLEYIEYHLEELAEQSIQEEEKTEYES